jgi:hypothetical protein
VSGRVWSPNGTAAWQFLCGVRGADATQALLSREIARDAAIEMRDVALEAEVCAPGMTLGSRVWRQRCPVNVAQAH